jgi:hypothetical protein
MNLSDDKNKRLAIMAAIGLGVVILLAVLVKFVAMPLVERKKTAEKAIETTLKKLDTANKVIENGRGAEEKNFESLTELSTIARNYIVEDDFGEYAINAKSLVEKICAKAGVQLEGTSLRSGQTAVPRRKGAKGANPFSSLIVRTSTTVSYDKMVQLFATIAQESPYIAVTEITIAPTSDEEAHKVSFSLQIPIWANPEVGAQYKRGPAPLKAAPPTEKDDA